MYVGGPDQQKNCRLEIKPNPQKNTFKMRKNLEKTPIVLHPKQAKLNLNNNTPIMTKPLCGAKQAFTACQNPTFGPASKH